MEFKILNIEASDIESIKSFTDKWIGLDYYDLGEIEEIVKNNAYASFKVINDSGSIVGVRLTLAPGTWAHKDQYKDSLTPKSWRVKTEEVGYFKSLFISEDFQKLGLGKKLSHLSIKALKDMGAKAVVCHSWIQSPHDSSRKYLNSLGFEAVSIHEKFWYNIDYDCTRCGKNSKCVCDAQEMIKYL